MELDFQPKVIWDWLMTCPYIYDMYFVYGQAASGATTLLPLTAHKDRTVARFIDGTELRQCDFALVRFESMSDGPNDEMNINAQETMESIAEWLDEQGENGNFPAFARSRVIQKLYTLPTEIGYLTRAGDRMARFMLQFRIEYYCEE